MNMNSYNFYSLHQLSKPLLALEWPQVLSCQAVKVPKITLSWYFYCVMDGPEPPQKKGTRYEHTLT
jgi:hypothetical protein